MTHLHKGDHVRIRYHRKFKNRTGEITYISKYPHKQNIYFVEFEAKHGMITKAFERDEIELMRKGN